MVGGVGVGGGGVGVGVGVGVIVGVGVGVGGGVGGGVGVGQYHVSVLQLLYSLHSAIRLVWSAHTFMVSAVDVQLHR